MALPIIARVMFSSSRKGGSKGSALSIKAGEKQLIENLNLDLSDDIDERLEDFTQELKKHTPIDKGRARRGWRKKGKYKLGKRGTGMPVVENRVPYIDPLEKGHSKQAPDGMIKPAFEKAFNKRKRK